MLGISVYPYKEKEQETLDYITLAAKYGFGRLFTNLLNIDEESKDQILATMKKTILHARSLGMEVILDVNPAVFQQLGASYKDLTFFKEMGATGIRLDSAFDGITETFMTVDDSGLDIEINISNDTGYLENVYSCKPNKRRIIGCHNFYPQRFTGLDYDYFMKCSRKYKALGLRTAAFIHSPSADHGPHPYSDGLCTLEMHRDLPIDVQAKHLIAIGLIDDIIIANAYASEAELHALSELNMNQIELSVTFAEGTTALEKEIVLENQHYNRGDLNSYSLRSTDVRMTYSDKSIPPHDTAESLEYGDITIGNNDFSQYKAELNIVKSTMPNTKHQKNVVGKVTKDNEILIPYIESWSKFRFKEAKKGDI
ncbi:DUF871 domain-containing protein [Lactovum odontotermitis]